MLAILVMMVLVVGFIVLVERGERRIPVQYAKRVVGRKINGGQSTHLPLKVNAGGVITVIFASSLLAIPQSFLNFDFVRNNAYLRGLLESIGHSMPLYFIVHRGHYFLLLLLRFDHLQPQRSH